MVALLADVFENVLLDQGAEEEYADESENYVDDGRGTKSQTTRLQTVCIRLFLQWIVHGEKIRLETECNKDDTQTFDEVEIAVKCVVIIIWSVGVFEVALKY